MVLKLLLVPEVSVDDGADVGGPVREPPHHGGPAHAVQPRHLGRLPRSVTSLNYNRAPLLMAEVIL